MRLAVIGSSADPTTRHVVKMAEGRGIAVQFFELLNIIRHPWRFEFGSDPAVPATFCDSRLEPTTPIFLRYIDAALGLDDPKEIHEAKVALSALYGWIECVPAQVVNRPGHAADNGAKPLHEHFLAEAGMCVPDSLTSSNGVALAEFCRRGPTVVKALCGVRAQARQVAEHEFENFDTRRGPVHLQRRIDGADVRVHLVGEAAIAELIISDELDYRAAVERARTEPHSIPESLRIRMHQIASAAGFLFTGWDFKLTPAGDYHCLEMNPMPGFDSYDRRLSGTISEALFETLLCRR